VRGKLAALMINDLDAGIGRFGNTQVCFQGLMVVENVFGAIGVGADCVQAAGLCRARGKLAALMINDLMDAGIGRFGNTQVGSRLTTKQEVSHGRAMSSSSHTPRLLPPLLLACTAEACVCRVQGGNCQEQLYKMQR
jgi:hypothetical protein